MCLSNLFRQLLSVPLPEFSSFSQDRMKDYIFEDIDKRKLFSVKASDDLVRSESLFRRKVCICYSLRQTLTSRSIRSIRRIDLEANTSTLQIDYVCA